jgi:hypothetical protein
MGSTARDEGLTPAEVIVGSQKPQQIEGWTGEASYVLSHLRKKDLGTALNALAVAAGIVD